MEEQIPADMVVNAILADMVGHVSNNKACDEMIYHVGSSMANPVKYHDLRDYGFRYFNAKPCLDKEGNAIRVGKFMVLESMASFQRYLFIRYLVPLKGLELVNVAFCHYFEGTYLDINKKISIVKHLVQLYRPYLFFIGIFDDINREKLHMAAKQGSTLLRDVHIGIPNSGGKLRWRSSLTIKAEVKFVNAEQAKELVTVAGYTVLDVRDKIQFERAHIKSCYHVPLFVENQDNDPSKD
ncbi:fatty acyl-CoA reductase 3-like [Arachis ipaensis]|uniref:fatty acyl-CoA reductase 3-like n=1 Tax=Arachis ipaensis TaxID=130454 RepID=UPI000A2B3195|nr:fatty acyl-CoA reductase 3-like [Arachis ipaensis]